MEGKKISYGEGTLSLKEGLVLLKKVIKIKSNTSSRVSEVAKIAVLWVNMKRTKAKIIKSIIGN